MLRYASILLFCFVSDNSGRKKCRERYSKQYMGIVAAAVLCSMFLLIAMIIIIIKGGEEEINHKYFAVDSGLKYENNDDVGVHHSPP
mmetsp:Transcript_41366/g.72050  ORF Transcript_41366/g.72050 Transcript_41366/m.72050 type:complete len:87 (+) Transcript_41366:571-831(+)